MIPHDCDDDGVYSSVVISSKGVSLDTTWKPINGSRIGQRSGLMISCRIKSGLYDFNMFVLEICGTSNGYWSARSVWMMVWAAKNKEMRQNCVVCIGHDTRRARAVGRAISNVWHSEAYKVCRYPNFHAFRIAKSLQGPRPMVLSCHLQQFEMGGMYTAVC